MNTVSTSQNETRTLLSSTSSPGLCSVTPLMRVRSSHQVHLPLCKRSRGHCTKLCFFFFFSAGWRYMPAFGKALAVLRGLYAESFPVGLQYGCSEDSPERICGRQEVTMELNETVGQISAGNVGFCPSASLRDRYLLPLSAILQRLGPDLCSQL